MIWVSLKLQPYDDQVHGKVNIVKTVAAEVAISPDRYDFLRFCGSIYDSYFGIVNND